MPEQDVWNSADNAVPRPSVFFGRVDFDLYHCVLRKGEGAVVFDPAQHKEQEKRTNISITVTPLSSSPYQFLTERRVLAESREWASKVLPSIKALGLSTRELNNRWVRYEMVPTGRKFTGNDGIEKEATTFKFLQVYCNEDAAEAAAAELYSSNAEESTDSEPATSGDNGAERNTALSFLPGIVNMAGKDKSKVATMLAGMPLVSKYFTVDSPEVQELLVEEEIPF